MAQTDLPAGLMPSLKDRLIDPDSIGARGQPGYSLYQILESVREDLEDLLNTRRSHEVLEKHYAELAKSIATYGLPDLTSLDTSTSGKREAIGEIIERIITLHEPRLRNVRANLVRSRDYELRALFHIDAEFRADPAPKVSFETKVELVTGHATIQGKG